MNELEQLKKKPLGEMDEFEMIIFDMVGKAEFKVEQAHRDLTRYAEEVERTGKQTKERVGKFHVNSLGELQSTARNFDNACGDYERANENMRHTEYTALHLLKNR